MKIFHVTKSGKSPKHKGPEHKSPEHKHKGTQHKHKGGMKRVRKKRRSPLSLSLRALNPMSSERANSTTSVIRIPQFLSSCEIHTILEKVREIDLPMYTNNAADDINKQGEPVHVTSYLNTDNMFHIVFPWLADRIRKTIIAVNKSEKWGFALKSNRVNVRVAEYHEMYPGGSLSGMDHCDIGSLVTVDIMLQEGIAGGEFQTVGNDGHATNEMFFAGDALVFVSHKYHRVSQLREGLRKVMVLEYWNGEQRTCGHRCDEVQGVCCFSNDDSE